MYTFFGNENVIAKEELETALSIVFDTFSISENTNPEDLKEKNAFIELFLTIINRSIVNNQFNSKKDKLHLIRIADKINNLKELLALHSGSLSQVDIQQAGKHLGNKAQSAFGS